MTDRYAVIGNPIAKTKSPALHAAFAKQCDQNMTYAAILGPLDDGARVHPRRRQGDERAGDCRVARRMSAD